MADARRTIRVRDHLDDDQRRAMAALPPTVRAMVDEAELQINVRMGAPVAFGVEMDLEVVPSNAAGFALFAAW